MTKEFELFEITVQHGDTAYASDAEGAYLAYWTLRKEHGVQGTTVKITNLKTGTVVWNG